MTSNDGWDAMLHANAATYARIALENIRREFPSDIHHTMSAPGDFPYRPRDRSPVFFGSFDWHSCVEMHWLLVRLLRVAGEDVPQDEIRSALDTLWTATALAQEARFIGTPSDGSRQRPYGWGWALTLIHEIMDWDDPDARGWLPRFEPLADTLTNSFLRWLPKATYPVRYGVHSNSAFGLSRSLPYATKRAGHGEPALLDSIRERARGWYANDRDYPAGWEPSGTDFLSPALTEAELMTRLLAPVEFSGWLDTFLPGIGQNEPESIFTPAIVSDSTDGYIAHLHGLNLSRAWCWRRLAAHLPAGDTRIEPALAAARTHAGAALSHAVGDHYMVEHWLAAYAVLLLSPNP